MRSKYVVRGALSGEEEMVESVDYDGTEKQR